MFVPLRPVYSYVHLLERIILELVYSKFHESNQLSTIQIDTSSLHKRDSYEIYFYIFVAVTAQLRTRSMVYLHRCGLGRFLSTRTILAPPLSTFKISCRAYEITRLYAKQKLLLHFVQFVQKFSLYSNIERNVKRPLDFNTLFALGCHASKITSQ